MELSTQDLYELVLKDYPDVLNVEQVGELFGVSAKTVYKLLNTGKLESFRAGRAFRVPKYCIMKYIHIFDSQMYEQATT